MIDISNSTLRLWDTFDITKIASLETTNDFQLIVIDGMTLSNKQNALSAVWILRSRKFIVVSSYKFHVKLEDLQQNNAIEIQSYGWLESEYQSACNDENFYNSVLKHLDASEQDCNDKDDKITAKYYFAGHSARWMFSFHTIDVQKEITHYVNQVTNFYDLFSGNEGLRRKTSINQLVTSLLEDINSAPIHLLISQHTTRLLANKSKNEFLKAATTYAHQIGNLSFDGWIFQLDFLNRIRPPEPISIINEKGSEESWEVVSSIDFIEPSELQKPLLKDAICHGCWLIPLRINQGCYDVLQLLFDESSKNWILRMVQLTVAKKHSLKLIYVIHVINALAEVDINISKMEVVFVVPPDNQRSFEVDSTKITHHNDKIFKKMNWNINQYRVCGFKRIAFDGL